MKAPSFAAHEPRDLGIRHHISLIGVTWTVCEIWIELVRVVGAYVAGLAARTKGVDGF